MKSDYRTSARAIELAEWIVDAISEADGDWHAIELRTRELLGVAAREANDGGGSRAAQPPGARA